MRKRSLTYANYKLMRTMFVSAEVFLKELLGTSQVVIHSDDLLAGFFANDTQGTFMQNLRTYIVHVFKQISDQYPDENGPLRITKDSEIYVSKEMPKNLAEFITGRYR